jgi:hypothetical protein
VPSFEFALRERVSRLAGFRHACYAGVRSVERLKNPPTSLVLVSDVTEGVRLSDLLVFAEQSTVPLDIDAALCLLRQIVPAVAMLHEEAPDVAHGAIAPERIVVTPKARIVMVEHTLGAALSELQFSRERYWKELRVAVPGTTGPVSFGHRSDAAQVGAVALALILGRPLSDDETASRLADVVSSSWAISARGGLEPLPAGLRAWLMRAVQLDPRESFESAIDAQEELERVLGDSDYMAAPTTLEAFLKHYHAEARGTRAAAEPEPTPASPPPPSPSPSASLPPSPPPLSGPTPIYVPQPAPKPQGYEPFAKVPDARRSLDRLWPSERSASSPSIDKSVESPVVPAAFSSPAAKSAAPQTPPPSSSSTPVARPAESFVKPSESSVKPAESFVKPAESFVKAPESFVKTPESFVKAPESFVKAPESFTKPVESVSSPAEPVVKPAERTPEPTRHVEPPAPPKPKESPIARHSDAPPVKHVDAPLKRPVDLPPARHAAPPLDLPPPKPFPSQAGLRKWWPALAAAAAIIVVAAGVPAARRLIMGGGSSQSEGTLVVNTSPPGARLFVDGVERGATPLTVALKPGPHSLEVRGDGAPRLMPVTITAGQQITQYLELPKVTAAVGQLNVRSEPAGARVSVDGLARGTSPVTIAELSPGEHTVVLESDFGSVKHTVTIEAGITGSLVVPLSAPEGAPVSGWISVSSPAEVQLYENKRLVGTSQSDRLMVSAGRHELELVNESLGYRAVRTVQVSPGRVSSVKVDFPKGTIALNALPWAEVWVDGEKVGETPIGNLQLTIGTHDVLFRHPDLGEQRHKATISLATPARLSVDMRKK